MCSPVLVPCADLRLSSGRAAVRDVRTGEMAWFPARELTLLDGLLCVRATAVGVEDGLTRVLLPGQVPAWVSRVIRVDLPTAAA